MSTFLQTQYQKLCLDRDNLSRKLEATKLQVQALEVSKMATNATPDMLVVMDKSIASRTMLMDATNDELFATECILQVYEEAMLTELETKGSPH